MYGVYGIGGVLILILDIYVIFMILSAAGDMVMKLIWILVVLFLPLIGPILYLLLGRGGRVA
jgi:multisubunit Na+/H+ antiporter MnhG subunit